MRLNTSSDVKRLLGKQIKALQSNDAPTSNELKKASTIGYLANNLLKAIEVADVEKRLEEIERKMDKGR